MCKRKFGRPRGLYFPAESSKPVVPEPVVRNIWFVSRHARSYTSSCKFIDFCLRGNITNCNKDQRLNWLAVSVTYPRFLARHTHLVAIFLGTISLDVRLPLHFYYQENRCGQVSPQRNGKLSFKGIYVSRKVAQH